MKYDKKELCVKKLDRISVKTFNVHQDYYIKKLEKDYQVNIETGAYGKKYYILEPKQSNTIFLTDASQNIKCLKSKALKNIEAVLKAVLIDDVLPVIDEIVTATGISKSTVRRTVRQMYDEKILLEPETEIIRFENKYTGEIHESCRKKWSYIYYDNLTNGKRDIVDFPNIHKAWGEAFGEKIQELQHMHKSNYNHKLALKTASIHAWNEINITFNLEKGKRAERWNVSSEYKNLINRKYSCN